MINSLEVLNYRNIKSLRINSLGRVNLITGKNNTGKSTLLEAISIYANKGEIGWMLSLLEERGESYRYESRNDKENLLDTNLKILASFFHGRKIDSTENIIRIGTIEPSLFNTNGDIENGVSLRFVRYHEELIEAENVVRRKRIIIEDDNPNKLLDYKFGFDIRSGDFSYVLPLEDRLDRLSVRISFSSHASLQYIRTRNIELSNNGKLWDKIALSEKEISIIEALKIIEPLVERVAFVSSGNSERNRMPVVKLQNNDQVLPLRSMGDGINRILTIILALVNADRGYLLIDEFENGLHHSVQQKLWQIVFELAEKLNVQVFATTHSNDCIHAFESILNNDRHNRGKLIRLDNVDGLIKPIEFSPEELKIASQQNIDTR